MGTSWKFFVGIIAICGNFLNPTAARGSPCRDCNVLLVAMDALQARHVSHLGYSRKTTTNLDRLAGSGVSFTQAISPSSWTVPTYLSVFSSTFPSSHGLTNRWAEFSSNSKRLNNFKVSNPNLVTIAEVFKSAGYETGGFTGNSGVSAVLGYDKGFDAYTDETPFGGLENSKKSALAWLDRVKGKKFFMFLHGYDVHGQFSLEKDFRSRFTKPSANPRFKGTKEEQAELREAGLRGAFPKLTKEELEFWREWYDGKIAAADERLGEIIKDLKKLGVYHKTLIIVFSDHGTEFGEHGSFDHGHSLYDELIHVPFVISGPGIKGDKKIRSQVSTMDLFPTVLDLVGLSRTKKLEKQIRGISLEPALKGKKIEVRDLFLETDLRNFTHKRGIRTADGWKFIVTLETGKEELFNLRKDPGEKSNLVEKDSVRAAALRSKLMTHLSDLPLGQNKASDCLPVYKGQCE